MDRKIRHPSERPIRKDDRERRLGFTRRPFDEPLTPGLRRDVMTNAIGFTAHFPSDEDEE